MEKETKLFGAKRVKTTVNITAFKILLAAMSKQPRSKKELHEITGLTNTTISRWMAVLSSGKDRIVYIERWDRKAERGCYTAMWRMGWGMPDAPKPKPLTQAEYAKRWRNTQVIKQNKLVISKKPGVIKHVSK